jgi:aldehyde dehydrogenase (NAD+)
MAKTWNYQLYIDGTWTPGEGEPFTVINPADETVIGEVQGASTKDAVAAIEAARRAFDEGPWPWLKPKERAAALIRMAESLEARLDELADLTVAQTGATGDYVRAVQGAGSIGMFRSNAALAEHGLRWMESGAPTGGPGGMSGSAIVREPVGVVAAITPFNFPFMLNVVKVAPALAAGCTIVLKPHPWTPLDAFFIAQAAQEAGIPAGVFNVITGEGDVGDELTSNPLVDMVTFTGSTATGRRILASAASTVKRVKLELGGKSAQLVLGDVGEDYARSIGFGQAIVHCGQGCSLTTRLLLPENLLEAYRQGVLDAAPTITIGDPRDPGTVLGPLISERQRRRVEELVQSGVEEGAEVITGGRRPPHLDKGFFFEPTAMVGHNNMRIAQEEIFGPVLTVVPYSGDDDEGVRLANESIYGLAGTVVSASTSRAFNAARRIRAGSMVAQGIGSTPAAASPGDGQGPGWGAEPAIDGETGAFGGFKQSGIGREWGHHGLEEFTEIKSIKWS